MKVLFATSEIAPWVKTGGLGDVAAALPPALAAAGVDMRVLVPAYPALREAFPETRE
ncbi:starch synthase, partial [bacterium]|nr:starch synthase [bacterium]